MQKQNSLIPTSQRSESLFTIDEQGQYLQTRPLSASELIQVAEAVAKDQLSSSEFVNSVDYARTYIKNEIGASERELFGVLFLDNKHKVIAWEVLFMGSISSATVHAREVIKAALRHNAAAVILGHNHPSGDTEPSRSDKALTEMLAEALKVMDIRTIDHIIASPIDTLSFAEKGLI